MHYSLKKYICGLAAGLFLSVSLPGIPSHAFCTGNTELSSSLQNCFSESLKKGETTQGFCIAGDCFIYTRYTSDSSRTFYDVIDRKTGEILSSEGFYTKHSNSLTYNPDTGQVAAVSKKHAYVFSFDGEKLSLEHDYTLNHNCPKIAYVSSEGKYYLGTSSVIYSTSDFKTLQKEFEVPKIAVNQGMGSDGQNLYVVWYEDGNSSLYEYDLCGNHLETYTLKSEIYREIEDADFDGDSMYLNIAHSGSANGIYMAESEHDFGQWKTTKKESCGKDGEQERSCARCKKTEKRTVKATGKHEASGWKYTKKAGCETEGEKQQECTVCGKILTKQAVEPSGHSYGPWETQAEATVLSDGLSVRTCSVCGRVLTKPIDKLPVAISMDDETLVLGEGDRQPARKVKLNAGDRIEEWISSDKTVAEVSSDGTVYARKCGNAIITCISAGGAAASYSVKVSFVKSIMEKLS